MTGREGLGFSFQGHRNAPLVVVGHNLTHVTVTPLTCLSMSRAIVLAFKRLKHCSTLATAVIVHEDAKLNTLPSTRSFSRVKLA